MTVITAEEISDYLAGLGIEFTMLEHPPAGTSEESFAARLAAGGRAVIGAKALVIWARRRSSKDLILVVLRGSDRLSSTALRKFLRNLFGESVSIVFAGRDEIRAHLRGLDQGRVPPLGPPLLPGVSLVLADRRIFEESELGFNAGDLGRSIVLSSESLRLALGDSVRIGSLVESNSKSSVDLRCGIAQFHLAFPSVDLKATEAFYRGLGCVIGRQNSAALTINFFGNQIVAHRVESMEHQLGIYPRHFGVIVDEELLRQIEGRLTALTPETTTRRTRFAGLEFEHETVLALDPSGNQLEFKHYKSVDGALGDFADGGIGDTEAAPSEGLFSPGELATGPAGTSSATVRDSPP